MKKTIQVLMTTALISVSGLAHSQVITGTVVSTTGVTAALFNAVTETIISPYVSTSATTLAAARVELEAVQADANDYLAGADKTEMLEDVMNSIRSNSKEDLSQVSDVEIAVEILGVTL